MFSLIKIKDNYQPNISISCHFNTPVDISYDFKICIIFPNSCTPFKFFFFFKNTVNMGMLVIHHILKITF